MSPNLERDTYLRHGYWVFVCRECDFNWRELKGFIDLTFQMCPICLSDGKLTRLDKRPATEDEIAEMAWITARRRPKVAPATGP